MKIRGSLQTLSLAWLENGLGAETPASAREKKLAQPALLLFMTTLVDTP